MREKALELMRLTVGTFDTLIDSIAIENFQGADPSTIPEQLQQMLAVVKDTLTKKHSQFEDAIVAVYEKYFTEADVDAMLAFNHSVVGEKLRSCSIALQNDLIEATANWRNDALKENQAEISRILGVVEPAPAPPPDSPAAA